MIRFFLRLLNYLLLTCFLGSLWGGWYLSKQGFGRKWRKKLSEEFAKRGVELTARRLTLDPLRGLVARNVRVFRDANQTETVAIIDELHLDINYTRLLRNEPFLDALVLSEAEVALDVDPKRKKSGEFTIHHMTAQLYFQQDKVEIRRLEGEGLGMHFSISGVLEHRPDWSALIEITDATNPGRTNNPDNPWQWLTNIPQSWLKSLAEVEFGKKTGRLDLRFRGNLAQKRWLQSAEVHLRMPEITWHGVSFDDLSAEGDFTDRLLTVRRFNWRDDRGPISISGNWRPGGEGHFLVNSRIDAPAIFEQVHFFPGFTSAERFQIKADLSWTARKRGDKVENKAIPQFAANTLDWQIVGSVEGTSLVYRGVHWDQLQTRFSLTPERWLVSDLNLQQKAGTITGEYLSDRGKVTADLSSTVDPVSLWQSLAREVPPWLDEFDFAVDPLLKVRISSPDALPGHRQVEGEIIFGRTSFRGVSLTSAQANFSLNNSYLTLNQIQITRPEGQLTAEAFWNATSGELRFWDLTNSLDLVALGLWTDRALADLLETVQLPKATPLQASGTLQWADSTLAAMDLHISAQQIAIFDLPIFASLAKNISGNQAPFQIEADVTLNRGILRVDPLQASNPGGEIQGRATWNLHNPEFTGLLEIHNASGETATWTARAPRQEITWRKAALSTPLN